MDVVVIVYNLTGKIPKEEKFGMSSQMRRAAISIPSNIAEGNSRRAIKEYIQFLYVANGSIAELETQLLLCVKLGFLKEDEIKECGTLLSQIGKMIRVMVKKLQNMNNISA